MKKILIILFSLLSFNLLAQNGTALSDGAIIYRPVKDVQFLYHYGVMYKNKVAHFNQTGFHYTTIDEFASGANEVKVLKYGLTGKDYEEFKIRAKKVIAKYKTSKYDAVHNNCEHFAMEMVYGVKKSIQSDMVVGYMQDYWPVAKKQMLAKNPNSAMYIDFIDTFLAKNIK
jgi:hypothetical protein